MNRGHAHAGDTHDCYVDCEPTERGGHVMYPAEPNRDAGRYQAARNLTMTRREYRASGQDESRECRAFNARRAAMGGAFNSFNEMMDSRRFTRFMRETQERP